MNSEAESINNFKFLIELSITHFSEFFNFKIIEKFTGFGGKFSLFEFRKRKKGRAIKDATLAGTTPSTWLVHVLDDHTASVEDVTHHR